MHNTVLISLSIAVLQFVSPDSLLAQPTNNSQALSVISLDQCHQWAREHYPLIQHVDLIEQATEFNLNTASNHNLPQINLQGQASYQSDVTQLPISIPNMEIPTLDKDQYKIYAELYQPLTNFSKIRTQKQLIAQNAVVEKQQVEVNLYQLKERINQIFFGSLLITEKIKQLLIIQSTVDSATARVEAGIQNGTLTQMDKQVLDAERISVGQQIEEQRANYSAFLSMLAALTGQPIDETTTFEKPMATTIPTDIDRPELHLFSMQNESIDLQQKQLDQSLLPGLGIFGQGGYGRPALNFLSNDFEFFFIGGLQLNWNISSLYHYKNTKGTLAIKRKNLVVQQETFLMNTHLSKTQEETELNKLSKLLQSDDQIISIRESILATAETQLSNGLITSYDYIKFLHDVNTAKQMQLLHEVQMLQAQQDLLLTMGH